ncbi:hypothetical protein COV20_00770 [Candidatus Woesearchaeota archaeon CG10_big_fil_rev_8_21_14_0_10_45_16]|nr:MAG: hypothetical protein COV20_00770 [Candidatus Woesearchaeota archaeon CG10_big_fil_rev_8_21_14_0_10_45_16]
MRKSPAISPVPTDSVPNQDHAGSQGVARPPNANKSYTEDGRTVLPILLDQFERHGNKTGWQQQEIYKIGAEIDGRKTDLPCYSFTTEREGPAVYLIGGIHGEEPAGPNALAKSLALLDHFSDQRTNQRTNPKTSDGQNKKRPKEGIPMVLIPLANPLGYALNWRYYDHPSDGRQGHSVGDSEHLLLREDQQGPRTAQAASEYAARFTEHVRSLLERYPPLLSIDFHEDDDIRGPPYIYSQGPLRSEDLVAKSVVQLLQKAGMGLQMTGKTTYGEEIRGGIAYTSDGSIDEFLAAEKYWHDDRAMIKPAARSVIVVETPIHGVALERRIAAHQSIIRRLPQLWEMVQERA